MGREGREDGDGKGCKEGNGCEGKGWKRKGCNWKEWKGVGRKGMASEGVYAGPPPPKIPALFRTVTLTVTRE